MFRGDSGVKISVKVQPTLCDCFRIVEADIEAVIDLGRFFSEVSSADAYSTFQNVNNFGRLEKVSFLHQS